MFVDEGGNIHEGLFKKDRLCMPKLITKGTGHAKCELKTADKREFTIEFQDLNFVKSMCFRPRKGYGSIEDLSKDLPI